MLAPKTVCLILLLEQILERAVKLLVTYKNRKHLASPQGWGQNGYSHSVPGAGLTANCALFHTTPIWGDKKEWILTDRAIETQHSSGCLGAFEVRWVQICPLQPPSLIYLSLSLLIWKHEALCQCKLSFRTSLKILRSGLSLTHRINLPCGPQSIFSDWVDEQSWVRPRTGLGVDRRRREEILAAPPNKRVYAAACPLLQSETRCT